MITFINADNQGWAGFDNFRDKEFDWIVADPPYGINAHKGNNKNLRVAIERGELHGGSWDGAVPNDQYFEDIKRVSKAQLVWGGNYFKQLPVFQPKLKRIKEFSDFQKGTKEGCLVWDKGESMYNRAFNEAELAWISTGEQCWFKKMLNQRERWHPTQKPVWLYRYIYKFIVGKGKTVLDTHGGSFTSAIAAEMEGINLVIYERDPIYFELSLKKFKKHFRQFVLF